MVVVLENTIGGTIVFTRANTGIYNGTLSSAFVTNKTYTSISGKNDTGGKRYGISRNDSNSISVFSDVNAVFTDTILNNTAIEIRIYN